MAYQTFSPEQSGRKKKTLDDYEFLVSEGPRGISSDLGKGSYGSVKRVKDKQTGEIYAMKIMSKKSIMQYATKENLKREIGIQKSLFHPNIVKLYHNFEDEENVYLVLEYASNGTLFQQLRKKKKFSEQETFILFLQTCLGIDYLHKRKILHRDLKPENLLLDKDTNIKLCDFGWSAENIHKSVQILFLLSIYPRPNLRVTFCGTVDYMAPEMLKSQPYDHKLDIWCLGILLFELLHGYAPFKGKNDREKVDNIRRNASINFDPNLSPEVIDLIRNILRPIPSERYSMDEIFRHPWMKKYERIYGTNIQSHIQQQDSFVREYQMTYEKPDPTAPFVGSSIYDNPNLIGLGAEHLNPSPAKDYEYSTNISTAYNSQTGGNFGPGYESKFYSSLENKANSSYSPYQSTPQNYLFQGGYSQYNSGYKTGSDPLFSNQYKGDYTSNYSNPVVDKYGISSQNTKSYDYGSGYNSQPIEYSGHHLGEREKKSGYPGSYEVRRRRNSAEEYQASRNYGLGNRRKTYEKPSLWRRLLIGLGCIERDKEERY